MNVWQGRFPSENTLKDGYYGTCPVDAFPPNGYGLHNVTGNVWVWTAGWFDETFRERVLDTAPQELASGTRRVQKGGSSHCHASYCPRSRLAVRKDNEH